MSQRWRLRLLPQTSAALVAAALLAGCSSDDAAEADAPETAPRIVQPGAPGQTSRELTPEELETIEAPPITPADVRFMQRMIHHHAQALEMTALVPKRSSRKDVPLLAERMDISQKDEMDLMARWLEERGEEVPIIDENHADAHGVGTGLMPGMLSEAELKRLEEAKGAEFDRLFLRFMIRHHNGALTMVEELYASPGGGLETEIDAFARHVEADQRIELDRMEQLLAALDGAGG